MIQKLKALCPYIRAACFYFKKSTAKCDEYGRHTRASANSINHAVSHAHSQLSIDRSQSGADLGGGGGGVQGVATPPNGQSHSIKCSTTNVLRYAQALIYIAKSLVVVVVSSKRVVKPLSRLAAPALAVVQPEVLHLLECLLGHSTSLVPRLSLSFSYFFFARAKFMREKSNGE